MRLVKLDIVDKDLPSSQQLQATFYLVDPDPEKLQELKYMIETRFDNAPDNEVDWSTIYDFIDANFKTLTVDTFEIEW